MVARLGQRQRWRQWWWLVVGRCGARASVPMGKAAAVVVCGRVPKVMSLRLCCVGIIEAPPAWPLI